MVLRRCSDCSTPSVISAMSNCDHSRTWALEAFKSWGSKQCPGPWQARGVRAYNGGLGAELPAGSRGRAPGGREAESFLVLERPTERQNSKMSKSIRLSLTS